MAMTTDSRIARVVTRDAETYLQAARRLVTLRAAIESALHEMAAALDDLDAPAEDLEDGDEDGPGEDDEPTCAAPEQHPSPPYYRLGRPLRTTDGDQTQWAGGPTTADADETEPEDEGDELDAGEEDSSDLEKSGDEDETALGATATDADESQEGWAQGGNGYTDAELAYSPPPNPRARPRLSDPPRYMAHEAKRDLAHKQGKPAVPYMGNLRPLALLRTVD